MLIYGICLKLEDINNEKAEAFLKELSVSGYTRYLEEFEENKKDHEEDGDAAYRFSDWIEDFVASGYECFVEFMHDVIEEKEHIDLIDLVDDNWWGYLGTTAGLPWDFTDRIKNLSKEEFEKLILKYWYKVSDQKKEFTWFDISE